MLTAPIFRPSDREIEALIHANPFALVISSACGRLTATPLPLLLDKETNGGWVLIGHFGRTNPQIAQLQETPRALIIFQGAHGYISPSWMRDRTQAPTWNYMMVQFQANIRFDFGVDHAVTAVDRLSSAMEAGRAKAWSPEEMGPRHSRLAHRVVAFRAMVAETDAKFKLGQNERLDVLEDILQALDPVTQSDLRSAMVHANRDRQGTGR